MIKFIGFLIILASSAKIGFDISEGYKNRTKELRSLENAMEIIKNEISFSGCILSDALMSASAVKSKSISKLLSDMSAQLKEHKTTASEAFRECMTKNKDILSLKNEDFDILSGFFSRCGTGNVEDEINNISSSVSAIGMNILSACEDEKKYVKLFRTTGILAGLMIGIIFI